MLRDDETTGESLARMAMACSRALWRVDLSRSGSFLLAWRW